MTQLREASMALPAFERLNEERRGNWVRLRTLIVIRWIALFGQAAAIAMAQFWFRLDLDVGGCMVVIAASVVANLVAMMIYPENKRLTEREVSAMLLFDMAQLSALVALNGGLHNPFALLILAPVTISATALHLRSIMVVGGAALVLTTAVALFHVPLATQGGEVLRMPSIFVFGLWCAIVTGIIFVSTYARQVTHEISAMSDALLATQMALAREQKLTDLGGVVAAAAHELGTPLATIKLASTELIEELSDHEDLREDARLIRDQADRCRDILRSMGRAGKTDTHLMTAPITAILHEAAEPHHGRGKAIEISTSRQSGDEQDQPVILRRPEIIHGLRNFIQNAVDFSKSRVEVEAGWSETAITVEIRDDGLGFPPQMMGRLGDPFLRGRETDRDIRPEYDGMGLGLFIAKTLLERTGAEIEFSNLPRGGPQSKGGALVQITWPRAGSSIEMRGGMPSGGANAPLV
jgi:two-component system sensor histidine kinase RegB